MSDKDQLETIRVAWEAMCAEVRDEMAKFVGRFTTPISEVVDVGAGLAWGTGNYIQLGKARDTYILTNEHVASRAAVAVLAHLPSPGLEYEAIHHEPVCEAQPYDLAIAKVKGDRLGAGRSSINAIHMDTHFAPVDGELLFWLGYPGTSGRRFDVPSEATLRRSMFGELPLSGFPMLSQQLTEWPSEAPIGLYPRIHALVHYPERAIRAPGESDVEVPSPMGLSGSLLWDTKVINCERSQVYWTPEHARVCGVVWATVDTAPYLAVTKVEHLHSWLEKIGLPVSAHSYGVP